MQKKQQPNLNTGFVYSVCSAWACVWYDNEGEFYHHMAYTQSAYIPALSDTSIVEIFSTATREKEKQWLDKSSIPKMLHRLNAKPWGEVLIREQEE